MAYLSLYRKYRPQTFSEILGQEHVARTLSNAIREDRLAHAYLFTGPRGTGKTSTARILAKAINCEKGPTPEPCGVCSHCVSIAEGSSLDVIEMDAASHSKVDETREVLAGVPLATAGSRKKVYVIDEVHMLSTPSFNALLKTLEEPPGHVLFILATTEAHKVLPTIISRTQRFDFRRVPTGVLEEHLANVAKLENIDIEGDAAAAVARHADGGVRDALSILDQLSNLEGSIGETEVEAALGGRTEQSYHDLFRSIAARDVGNVFRTLHDLVAAGADARQLALGVLEHARHVLLIRTSPDSASLIESGPDDLAALTSQAEDLAPEALVRIIELVARALTDMRTAPNHRLLLEIALVRAAAPETDPTATGLLGRIERLERRFGIEGSEAPPAASVAVTDAAPVPASGPSPTVPTAPQEAPGPEASPPTDEPAKPAKPAKQATSPPSASAEKKKPTKEVSAPPSAAGGVDASIGLSHVKDAWAATLQEVGRRSKRIQAFLNPSRPLALEAGRLIVEVQSSFHESTMSEEANTKALVDSLHSSLGIAPALSFVAKGSPPPPAAGATEAPASAPATTPPADDVSDVVDVEETVPVEGSEHDPVELVKKGLGAEVVEERTPR